MASFFRGSGLGALLPTAAAGAFVARSLAKRAAPAAMVLRATALPRSACGGARRRTVWAVRASSTAADAAAAADGAAADAPAPSVTAPFHLAIPVADLAAAREFYGSKLGCPEGRSASTWVDYSLYGHQLVCHVVPGYSAAASANAVDGDPVPVPHFGLCLTVPQFHDLAARVKAAGVQFVIEPHLRWPGQPGEQWTMFFKDPSGNALEFKAMTTPSNLFAKYVVQE